VYQPFNNDGSGSTNIGVYDISTGVAGSASPASIGGKPTGLTIDDSGNVTVDTQDAAGNSSSTNVLVN